MAQTILELARKLNKVIEEELVNDKTFSNEVEGTGKPKYTAKCTRIDCKSSAIGKAPNGFVYCKTHLAEYSK